MWFLQIWEIHLNKLKEKISLSSEDDGYLRLSQGGHVDSACL